MTKPFDILGLGCTTIDELFYVPHYPPADGKVRVNQRRRQCGGLTATALVAAARMGAECVFAGTLGENELSRFVLSHMQDEGIDISQVYHKPHAQPIHSVIIVDESNQSRTILYDTANSYGAQDNWPDKGTIQSARVLFVDPYGIDGMIRAARVCRDSGIPIVADFESQEFPRFFELFDLVDHLIVSSSFANSLTGKSNPGEMARQLWSAKRQAVIVTDGERGCWCVTDRTVDRPSHCAAYGVETVDTTGCGDIFHGAYAAALARGLGLDDRIRFAAAAAAIKATRHGGQAGIPTRGEVEQFIEQRQI